MPKSAIASLLKSTDSGAKSPKKNDFWHHYRHFSMFFCLFFDIL